MPTDAQRRNLASAHHVEVQALNDLITRLRFALGDPDGKMNDAQLTRRAHEVHQKADKWDDWHEAQNEIETKMPEGWRFVLDCSPGDWSLDLVDPDGNHVEFDHDCDSTAQMIRSAIDAAIASTQEQT